MSARCSRARSSRPGHRQGHRHRRHRQHDVRDLGPVPDRRVHPETAVGQLPDPQAEQDRHVRLPRARRSGHLHDPDRQHRQRHQRQPDADRGASRPTLIYTSLVSATLNGASVTPTVTGVGTSTPVFTFRERHQCRQFARPHLQRAGFGRRRRAGSYCNYFTSSPGPRRSPRGRWPASPWAAAARSATRSSATGTATACRMRAKRAWRASPSRCWNELAGRVAIRCLHDLDRRQRPVLCSPASSRELHGQRARARQRGRPAPLHADGRPGRRAATLIHLDACRRRDLLDADWGYKPGGAGSIGDMVFEDHNGNGVWERASRASPAVNMRLQNANGQNVLTTRPPTPAASTFTSLPQGLNYGVASRSSGAAHLFRRRPLHATPANPTRSPAWPAPTTADFGFTAPTADDRRPGLLDADNSGDLQRR